MQLWEPAQQELSEEGILNTVPDYPNPYISAHVHTYLILYLITQWNFLTALAHNKKLTTVS